MIWSFRKKRQKKNVCKHIFISSYLQLQFVKHFHKQTAWVSLWIIHIASWKQTKEWCTKKHAEQSHKGNVTVMTVIQLHQKVAFDILISSFGKLWVISSISMMAIVFYYILLWKFLSPNPTTVQNITGK